MNPPASPGRPPHTSSAPPRLDRSRSHETSPPACSSALFYPAEVVRPHQVMLCLCPSIALGPTCRQRLLLPAPHGLRQRPQLLPPPQIADPLRISSASGNVPG